MAYRDDLEAAQARIVELEGEVKRLEQQKAPARASWRMHYVRLAAGVMLLFAGFVGAYKIVGERADSARAEEAELRGRIHMLQESHESYLRDRDADTAEAAHRREELDGLAARIAEAEAHLRTVTVAVEPTPVPTARTGRLADTEFAARLALCTAYPDDPGEYPYAEGVVIRRDIERRVGGHLVDHVIMLVPNHEEVVHDVPTLVSTMSGASADVLLLQEFHDYRFWNEVEIGDIVGITWNAGGQIIGLRTTDK